MKRRPGRRPGAFRPVEPPAVRLSGLQVAAVAAAAAAVLLYYLVVELRHNGRLGFPLDDSWIHMVFGRNLARGWGFAFNRGEPVAGSTAPLWSLILALPHLVSANVTLVVAAAKLLAAVCLGVGAVYAGQLATVVTGSRRAGLAAGLAVATSMHMGWATVSGMEVALSVALTLAGCYYLAAGSRGWKAYLPWVLFGLAAYARPESLLLPLFLVADRLVNRFRYGRRVLFWRGLGACAVTLLPLFILNFSLAGSPFPQTYTVKAGHLGLFAALARGDAGRLAELLTRTPAGYIAGFAEHLWQANPVLALLVPVGIAALVTAALRRREAGLVVPLAVLLYVPLTGVVAPYVRPAFQNGRYIGNATALAVLAAVIGGHFLVTRFRDRRWRALCLGLLAAPALFNVVTTNLAAARNTARATSTINRMQVTLAEWLAAETGPDAVVAANDVGAIGYLSRRRTLDMLGLVSRDAVSYVREWNVTRDGRRLAAYVTERRPDYLVIFPHWFPELARAPFVEAMRYVTLEDNYASAADFSWRARTLAGVLVLDLYQHPAPVSMVVFRCHWPRRGVSPAGRKGEGAFR